MKLGLSVPRQSSCLARSRKKVIWGGILTSSRLAAGLGHLEQQVGYGRDQGGDGEREVVQDGDHVLQHVQTQLGGLVADADAGVQQLVEV